MPADTPSPQPDWSAVKALFDEALALPPDQRAGFLAAARADDAVRAEVASLLAHAGPPDTDAAATGFMSAPAASQLASGADSPAPAQREGLRLGPWQLLSPLGAGGMGEVWRARRADGAYDGQAAVKILKRGMDSASVLARFAQEQRALARLNHPHIARLFDAGITPDGLPYFVMELVEGRPIDQAAAGLPLEARLALFLQLADAVSHAHRQLLVHRDLKPSNVLVDGERRVKLLDFGIAKAIDPAEAGAADTTQLGQRPFTPHFASPEQVRGEPVGTGTDIYSLGVLLYVLLTGIRPYGRAATTPAEAARSVLEDEPTRPSALSPALVPDPAWESTRRRLQGDLDNILLKALAKEGAARYPSVDALAADLHAYLQGYPVSARPAGWGYRLRKFVRRNRVASAAGALAVLAMVAGTTLALWQSRVAERERARAERRFDDVRKLAGQLVFKYHDQMEFVQGATKVREALLEDAAAFLDSLREAATDDPKLAHELSTTYYRIAMLQGVSQTVHTGRFAQAEASLDKAVALHALYARRADTAPEVVADAADMLVSKAEAVQRRGRMQEAVGIMGQALALVEPRLARDADEPNLLTSAIGAHGVLARMLGTTVSHANLGRLDEARGHLEQAVALARRLLAPSPANVESLNTLAFALGELANWHAQMGQPQDAARVFGEQLALRDRNAAAQPDDMQFRNQRAIVRSNLAGALAQSGRHAEARQSMDEAQALAREIARADPDNLAAVGRVQTLKVLDARLRVIGGDLAGARALLAEALPGVKAGADFPEARWRAEALLWAARAWRDADARKALAYADESVALMAGQDDNAARGWMRALGLGERALALAALPGADASGAPAAAREALATWQAPPAGGRVPGSYAPYVAPVRALAAQP